MAAKKPTPKKSPAPKKSNLDAIIKEYQRQVSPKGVASASAAASKAMDKKYPGLYKNATPKATLKKMGKKK
jgi:hypothetical protein